jgi:hypothetical protein
MTIEQLLEQVCDLLVLGPASSWVFDLAEQIDFFEGD